MKYFKSLLLLAITTFAAWLFHNILPSRDLIMLYLLAVVFTAFRWGSGPAVMASFASVLIFDFFFVFPHFSFIAVYAQDWVLLAVFFSVGFLISNLTAKAREGAKKVQAMELLREKEKLQSVLLSSVSHDLRTPLASITGTLSGLLHQPDMDPATRQELVETAYGESSRLNQLVGNLLDMTRLEAGAAKVSLESCEVQDLVGAALNLFPKNRLESYKIKTHFDAGLPEVKMDFTLMMKVLMNLIDNALKYSPEGSQIDIQAKMTDEGFCLEILDEGPGIPEKDLRKVFEKFYRVENRTIGTGLGLSICKGIVEAHHGKITAENLPGRGAKFAVILPPAHWVKE